MKSNTKPKKTMKSFSPMRQMLLRLRFHRRRQNEALRRQIAALRRRNAVVLPEENTLFQSTYNKEMESSQLVRRGLSIPRENFSYRTERIGGQNILPVVLNQGGMNLCHFMATTSCVEARYRLYLARTQNNFQYGRFEGGRQPSFSSLFEKLAWHSWTPPEFDGNAQPGTVMMPARPNVGQEWLTFTQPITTSGIAIEREYRIGSDMPWTHYRAADLKNYNLNRYRGTPPPIEHTTKDWATLTTELKMRGPFVANFRPSRIWAGGSGKDIYVGTQGTNEPGHAVLVIGFERNIRGRFFEIMNSYGPRWGLDGFGTVRMECLDWILMPSIVPLDLNRENIQP